jgi:hypothetical protein
MRMRVLFNADAKIAKEREAREENQRRNCLSFVIFASFASVFPSGRSKHPHPGRRRACPGVGATVAILRFLERISDLRASAPRRLQPPRRSTR